MEPLKNKQVALVVGHPPNDGAPGEREYNSELALMLHGRLENLGAEVHTHFHTISSYSQRQKEMRERVKEELPNCGCCIELHYNYYHKESANGHEFLYRGSRKLAECFQESFSKFFPWSKPRSGGIKQVLTGNGAGFLKQSPAWACLVEPFFGSNDKEEEYFNNNMDELADCYCEAICDFLT